MATWTARVTDVQKSEKSVSFTADIFRDGVTHHVYEEKNLASPESIEAVVKQHLELYERVDSFDPEQAKKLIDTSKPVPETPADQIALKEFLTNLAKYRGALAGVKLGLWTEKDPILTEAKEAVVNGFIPEYLPFIGGVGI